MTHSFVQLNEQVKAYLSMPEDKSESNKDIFDSHPCFMEKSEKMQADVKVKVLYLECKIIQCLCTS